MAQVPGSSRLVLVDGVVHLDEERAVFEAMLTGWARIAIDSGIGSQ
jgi:integrase/recombinase XerC